MSIPVMGEPSITALAKKHGLPRTTVQRRHLYGDRGDRLIRPSEHRGKPVLWGGKTFQEWHAYLRERGVYVEVEAIRQFYYARQKRQGDTPEEALERFKKNHGVT